MLQVIVEISLYPLTQEYETVIADFVQKLRAYDGVVVTPGETSTVIWGDYDLVFAMLQAECKTALNSEIKTTLVVKILNTA